MAPEQSPFLKTDRLAATLAELVAIDSVNPAYGGPAGGEARLQERAARMLAEAGLEARIEPAMEGRPNLRARLEGESTGPPLLLQTHIDTVSTAGMSIDPFAAGVENGRLYGRGSVDAKGQATALIHAMAAWADSGRRPPRPVELVLAVDEESGFGGARAMARAGVDAAAIVIAEPTLLRVVSSHKGTLRLAVRVEGRAAHAARPSLGVNSISAAAALVAEIDEYYAALLAGRQAPLLGAPTINTSLIQGGVQINLVPPETRLQLDRRTIPGEDWPSVRAEFEELFQRARRRFRRFQAVLEDPILDAPGLATPPDAPIVRAASAVAESMGRPGEPIGVDYATDACALGATGLPIVVVGPGSIDQAHTADEYIELDELAAGALFFTRLIGS